MLNNKKSKIFFLNFLYAIRKILVLTVFIPVYFFSQKYYIGDRLVPDNENYKLLGISTKTNVHSYQYTGEIKDKYFYNRKIGEIIIGIKDGIVVTTIYNLIPNKDDVGVPQSIINLIEQSMKYKFGYINGIYGMNVDDVSISVSRTNSAMTFNKDRIMFLSSIRQSILLK